MGHLGSYADFTLCALMVHQRRLQDEVTRKAFPSGKGTVLSYFGTGGNVPLNRVEILGS